MSASRDAFLSIPGNDPWDETPTGDRPMIATPPAPSYLATELRYAITMLNSSMIGIAREVLSELLTRVNASRTDVVRAPVFASDDERYSH